MEPLFDPSSPIHATIVLVPALAGGLSAWLGLRDGFLRKEMRTNAGLLVGSKAMVAGAMYIATGLVSVAGAIVFFVKARSGG